MIEARIRRALWTISILVAFGFGAHAATNYFNAYQIDAAAQQWHSMNDSWYLETCNQNELDPVTRSECERLRQKAVYFSYEPGRLQAQGSASLAIAVAAPVTLWALFFLTRWIWAGNIRRIKSPETERLSLREHKLLYWILGAIACAALFFLNVLMLPSGRAVQVLISSVVQVVGLVLAVWIARTLYDAVIGRLKNKQAAAKQAVPENPSQASGHSTER